MRKWIWQGRPWQAFKSFAILFSFTMNLVLLIALLLAVPHILPVVGQVAVPLVGGLSESFEQMGAARIERTIVVADSVPVQFDVPLNTTSVVTLAEPVPITVPASFVLPAGGGTINGTVALELPAGTNLPINLDLTVPVSNTIPVNLDVAVDIPLSETDLGRPFTTLQQLFSPLDVMLRQLPADNDELINRLTHRNAPPTDDTAETAQDAAR
ncbi:MAG: hypothetical protein GX579_21685 [Chloroflexi bacterium]|jgi:hypothetical protein|nr:hypothetical protein [Chloroflexota bacterium]